MSLELEELSQARFTDRVLTEELRVENRSNDIENEDIGLVDLIDFSEPEPELEVIDFKDFSKPEPETTDFSEPELNLT